METPTHPLTPDDREALEKIARTEAETLHAYTVFLPQLDTPELRDKLKIQVDRHHEISRSADAFLGVFPTASSREEVAMPAMAAPLGDTLDTLKSLEQIEAAERLSRQSIKAALESNLSERIGAQMRAWLDDLRVQEMEFEKVLTSVRAAAQLWGPADEIPVLHH